MLYVLPMHIQFRKYVQPLINAFEQFDCFRIFRKKASSISNKSILILLVREMVFKSW